MISPVYGCFTSLLSSKIDHLFADELVRVELVLAFVVDELVLHAREERGQLMVIVLRPAIERMVVALGTLHADAEKNLGGRLGPAVGVAQGPIVIGGRLVVGAAAAGDQFAGEFIERLVAGDGVADPFIKDLHAAPVELLFLIAEQIGPFESPELGKLGTFQQGSPSAGPVCRHACVGQKLSGLLGRRQNAEQIEMARRRNS